MRVLIVDDELGICQRLQRELQKEGCEVEYTTSAIGVLKRLKSAEREGKTYALLLLDLRMPKVDGLSLLKEIRQARLGLEVVIITGYGDEDKAIESIRLGAVDYLPKPISLEALHTAVFRVQQKRAAEEKKALEYSVLVVDDEKELCERIKRELDKEGYRTAVAYDGVEGLDYFSHNRVDVAIVDIKMPRMSGLEMLKKCREISDDFVSIIITGHGDHERAIQALQLGAFNYLRKPISLEELVTSVGKGIELLHLRRDLAARRRELEIETALKEQYANNLEKMVEERTKEIKKLSDAVKASTESIVISDLEGKITDVNEATLRMYGTGNKEDLVGKSSFDLIAPEDREKAVAAMEEVLEKGYVKDREYHVITKDGSKLPVEMSVSIMKGMDGEPIGFVGITMNITERKRAAEELHRKEEHHKAVIENIFKFVPEGVLVLTESLNLLKQNKAFDDIVQKYAPLLGYTEEELAQKIIEQLRRKIESEDSKEIHIGKNDQLETGISGRDELIFQFNTARMFLAEEEEEEEEARIVVSLLDVTERKRTEEELKQSEQRYRTIVETVPDVIYTLAADDGRFTSLNPAFETITGWSREEWVGKTFATLVHPEDMQLATGTFQQVLRGEYPRLYELRILAKSGEYLIGEFTSMPHFKEGKIVGELGIARDITERKLLEKKLINSKEQLRALASRLQNVREEEKLELSRELHDNVGQMLTALQMDISFLEKNIINRNRKINPQIIKKKFSGIVELLNSSIDIVREISTNLRPAILDSFGLIFTIEWYLKEFQKKSGIVCNFISEVKKIKLNPHISIVAYRILQEALTNIIRHSQATLVEVRFKKSQSKIILEIKDNGIGISNDALQNVNSLGLSGMRERALSINGDIIFSGLPLNDPLATGGLPLNDPLATGGIPGKGTTVVLSIPINVSKNDCTESNPPATPIAERRAGKV